MNLSFFLSLLLASLLSYLVAGFTRVSFLMNVICPLRGIRRTPGLFLNSFEVQ